MDYLVLIVVVILSAVIVLPGLSGAVWLPVKHSDLQDLLKASNIQPGETVIDIGSGDARVLFAAVREFNAKSAIGFELDPLKVIYTKILVRYYGLNNKIRIRWKNVFKLTASDIANADVVVIYMSHQANERLAQLLLSSLKPSARLVSYGFLFRGISPLLIDPAKRFFIYKPGKGLKTDTSA